MDIAFYLGYSTYEISQIVLSYLFSLLHLKTNHELYY